MNEERKNHIFVAAQYLYSKTVSPSDSHIDFRKAMCVPALDGLLRTEMLVTPVPKLDPLIPIIEVFAGYHPVRKPSEDDRKNYPECLISSQTEQDRIFELFKGFCELAIPDQRNREETVTKMEELVRALGHPDLPIEEIFKRNKFDLQIAEVFSDARVLAPFLASFGEEHINESSLVGDVTKERGPALDGTSPNDLARGLADSAAEALKTDAGKRLLETFVGQIRIGR